MEQLKVTSTGDKVAVYRELLPQLESLVSGERDPVANLANLTAALKQSLPYASWVGYYLMRDNELVVGPFQGKVACTRISPGRGVCGAAAAEKKTIVVPDVNDFPGHIYCDPDSRSEIVVPLLNGHRVLGVLDLDSSGYDSFDAVDAENLEHVAELTVKVLNAG